MSLCVTGMSSSSQSWCGPRFFRSRVWYNALTLSNVANEMPP